MAHGGWLSAWLPEVHSCGGRVGSQPTMRSPVMRLFASATTVGSTRCVPTAGEDQGSSVGRIPEISAFFVVSWACNLPPVCSGRSMSKSVAVCSCCNWTPPGFPSRRPHASVRPSGDDLGGARRGEGDSLRPAEGECFFRCDHLRWALSVHHRAGSTTSGLGRGLRGS